MTTRRRLNTKEKVEIYLAADGRCHICGGKIQGKEWDVEHVLPLAQGGADDDSNMRPAHRDCHKGKTAKDADDTARAKRRFAKHIGAKKPSSFPKPPPGYVYDWRLRKHVKETA